MDSLTHIVLGACMGEAFAGNTVGKKAMIWGILAQSVPDIDFLAAFWLDTPSNLLAHRGFTHSILFSALMTMLLAILAERWHRPHNISLAKWIAFFGAVILGHIFLDAFNNYGVGWFEPFSHTRISFNILYVADPFFSAIPAIAFVMLLWFKKNNTKRKLLWRFGLGMSLLYLGYCVINKVTINRNVKKMLAKQQIHYTRFLTTPAPLQNWLWYIVAGTDSGYYVGYRSVFEHSNKLALEFFPSNDSLLQPVEHTKEVEQLIRFSQHFYTVEKKRDTLIFNDLRFGQIIGWQNPKEQFVFYYFLQPEIDNTLVVQRGRFAKWDEESFKSMVRRIRGD